MLRRWNEREGIRKHPAELARRRSAPERNVFSAPWTKAMPRPSHRTVQSIVVGPSPRGISRFDHRASIRLALSGADTFAAVEG
jgi:hypothetical protein